MSVNLVRAVLDNRDARISGPEQLVMLVYAEHANEQTGVAWPSAGTVAAESHLATSTVAKSLTKLQRLGYLRKTGKKRVGEHAWVWIYEVRPVEELRETENPNGRGTPRDAVEELRETETNRKEEPEVKDKTPNGVLYDDEQFDDRPRSVVVRPIFDALAHEWDGLDTAARLPRAQASRIASAEKQLREVGATADDVRERAAEYRRRFSGCACTPQALVKHWATLRPGSAPQDRVMAENLVTLNRMLAAEGKPLVNDVGDLFGRAG